jgi:hypothetical protein
MFYIAALIIFISDGYEQEDILLHTINFNTKQSCEEYLNSYDSILRLNLTKMFEYNKLELKKIVDLFCVQDKNLHTL